MMVLDNDWILWTHSYVPHPMRWIACAGYRWILQRAGLAKFVRLMMGEKGAASLVKALKAHVGSPFKRLKVLKVKDFSRLSAFQFSRPDCNRVLRMALRAYPGIPGPPLRVRLG